MQSPRHQRASIAGPPIRINGRAALRLPYSERHALLEEVTIEGPPSVVEIIDSFDDGPALWDAIVDRGSRVSSRSASGSRTGPVRGCG
jgi:hypothetical protein